MFCQSLTKTWYCSKKSWKTWKTCRAACLHRILHMPWHGLICLNMTWICLNRSEFMTVVRVLNMSHTIQSVRSSLKLLKDIIFGTLLQFLTILADTPSWIFERVLSNCRVLNMSGLGLFQNCQYAKVLEFRVTQGFTYFGRYDSVLNRWCDAIIEGFWIFQDSKYARFLHIRGLNKPLNMLEYGWIMSGKTVPTMAGFWICLIKVSQGFEYASGSNYATAQNMERLWICEGYTRFFNNTSICVSMP